jgi:hypothetical protein
MKTLETDLNINLTEKIATIMNEAGSDKQRDHNYAHAYSYFLSKLPSLNKITFLEIGIANVTPDDSSIHGWAKVFEDGLIYGIDIHDYKMINAERIKTFVANQGSIVELSRFREEAQYPKFDVILDDGSHIFSDAVVSFKYLLGCLKENGVYMIEDVRKNAVDIQQSVVQWQEYLNQCDGIEYEIIDCQPDRPNDDSIVIGIWRK